LTSYAKAAAKAVISMLSPQVPPRAMLCRWLSKTRSISDEEGGAVFVDGIE
jgi:hypothetical protein